MALGPLTGPRIVGWAAFVAALSLLRAVLRPRSGLGRRRQRLGVLIVAAAASELWWSGNAPWGLALPLLALLAAGWLLTPPIAGPAGWVSLATGAVLVGVGPASVPGPGWVRTAAVGATLALALALREADTRWGSLVLPLLTVSAIGVYGTTPDTEQSAVLLTVVAAVTVVGWWVSGVVGPVAAPALAGLVVWTIGVGGRGSHPSIVGSFGCLGLLLLQPVAGAVSRGAGSGRWWRNRWFALVPLGALQAAIVAGGHAAGVSRSLQRAALQTAAALGLATVVVILAAALEPRDKKVGGPPDGGSQSGGRGLP